MKHGALLTGAACLLLGGCDQGAAPAPDPSSQTQPLKTQTTPTPLTTATSVVSTVDCADAQATIFACSMKDGKAVRVCRVSGPDGNSYAQYRFGPVSGASEIVLPAKRGQIGAVWSSVPYSGGGEALAAFTNRETRYIVYSRVIRTRFDGEGNDPVFQDGVNVQQNGLTIARLECDGQADPSLDVTKLKRIAPAAGELPSD